MLIQPKKMVPPDGGWGWIAVIGVAIVNFCTRSIEPSFGLLFGDLLKELGVGTTGAALIMSTLDALINFSGLLVGPLIRAFSYRKVSLVGACLCGLGLVLTFPARSMAHILVTYSIINGVGVGLTASATFVALNHYFVKRRGQALGFSLAGTAFGMLLMPQAVRLLLEAYSFRGAILVLGGVALHALIGSALLQPAEWHFVPESKNLEEGNRQKRITFYFSSNEEMETIKEVDDEEAESPESAQTQKLIGVNTIPDFSKCLGDYRPKEASFPRNFSTMSFLTRSKPYSDILNYSSLSSMDFTGSSLQLHLQSTEKPGPKLHITEGVRLRRNLSYPAVELNSHLKLMQDYQHEPLRFEPRKKETLWSKIVNFMDLDLLKDPIYLNLVFGLSIFYVAEQNFKMVTPFFFDSIGYNKTNTALFLSVQAITDILARLILPPICDRVNVRKRTLFMVGIFLVGISRSVLAEQTDYTMILVWLFVCGFVRGAALINFTITISEYSTLDKLPAAFGLHMVGKGLFVVALGPVLGYIRDATRSYPICLHSQTFLIMLCCLAWSIEYIIVWFKTRTKDASSDNTST
ncbi:uncharacterized protein LOC116167647 isoform X2 [Photinus pyralis]|uniref:uncharacterized protein LOC116167647 isoform X2 n=1 Tax=Photinus pyralis TaxID=7054 RepID=UPI00126713A8|nr:uncharacterized protein LOC116167647 isoform X2 [Photinus pyralis]